MRANPEVNDGPEFGDRKGQLIVGFNGALVWPGKPPEVVQSSYHLADGYARAKTPAQMHGPRAGLVLLLLQVYEAFPKATGVAAEHAGCKEVLHQH